MEGERPITLVTGRSAAVVTLREILAREDAPFGIAVNAVGPVPTDTEMSTGISRETPERTTSRQAVRGYATSAEIAIFIDSFLRRESDLFTGQTICLWGV